MPTTMFGLEFAPLRIPIERRLQTFAVLQWTFSFLFLGLTCLGIMLYLCFTWLYIIPVVYLPWYIYDRRTPHQGGRPWEWVRGWSIWRYYRDYFPISLVKTAALDSARNYILAFHPHGIMADGAFCNFATDATGFSGKFPGMKPVLLTINYQFLFPMHREYFMTTGACSCSAESMKYWLTTRGTGIALVLVVGGAYEALEARPGSFTINAYRRKGFVRMALQYGADIVPVYSFGENDLFEQVQNPDGSFLRRVQLFLTRSCGFSAPVFHGRGVFNYSFGLVPFRRPINTVVGAPIRVDKVENPDDEMVDKLHGEYIRELNELFETHKVKFGLKVNDHLNIT